MERFFPEHTAQELMARLQKLAGSTPPLWGEMNAAQMLAHCCEVTKEPLGEKEIIMVDLDERTRKELLFEITKDNAPMGLGIEADEGSIITGDRDFEIERLNFITTLDKLSSRARTTFEGRPHPFFGNMSADQWFVLTYKHLYHHLRQFGV